MDLGLGDGRCGCLGCCVGSTIPAVCGTGGGLLALAGIVDGAFGAAVLLPALPAAIAWVGAAGLTNRIMHAASNRSRALLRKSFEHYLPPAVIAQMLEIGYIAEARRRTA